MSKVIYIANLNTCEIIVVSEASVTAVLARLGWHPEDTLSSDEPLDMGDIACANGDREVACWHSQHG